MAWINNSMKKHILILIGSLVILMLNSCTRMPEKIEKYIKKHCDLEMTDTCYIDLRKALKTDYDTMYVFNSLTPLTGVQNIIGINDYGKCENPEKTLIGHDSEMCRIILVKDNKVVYEDEYHYNDYNTKFSYYDFSIVNGQGIFDGSPIRVSGYICTDYVFKVRKTRDKHYIVKKTGNVSNQGMEK